MQVKNCLNGFCITTFIILLFSSSLYSQTLGERIIQGKSDYKRGNLKSVISGLESESLADENKYELWQAYKLLSLAYLFTGEQEKAHENAVKMLEINPQYKLELLKDQAEFKSLVNSITILPKISIGVAFSTIFNYTHPVVRKTYNGGGYSKKYTNGLNSAKGAIIEYTLTQHIALKSGFNNTEKGFDVKYNTPGYTNTVSENFNYLEMPLALKLYAGKQKYRPYFFAGGYSSFLLSSYNDFNIKNDNDGGERKFLYINNRLTRRLVNNGLLIGSGFSLNDDPFKLLFELSYSKGLSNIVSDKGRLSQEFVIKDFQYIDDDVSMNHLLFSVGILYNISYRVIK